LHMYRFMPRFFELPTRPTPMATSMMEEDIPTDPVRSWSDFMDQVGVVVVKAPPPKPSAPPPMSSTDTSGRSRTPPWIGSSYGGGEWQAPPPPPPPPPLPPPSSSAYSEGYRRERARYEVPPRSSQGNSGWQSARPKSPQMPPRRNVYYSAPEYDPWSEEPEPVVPPPMALAPKAVPKRDLIAEYWKAMGDRRWVPKAESQGTRSSDTYGASGTSGPTNGPDAGTSSSHTRTQGAAASGMQDPTEAPRSGAAPSSRSWTWSASKTAFSGVDPDHIMWIRNAYSELEQYLLRKYSGTRDVRSYVDSMLQKMHTFCMVSGKSPPGLVAGDSLLSKWKRWMCHAVLAMSDTSDTSMSSTSDWLSPRT